MAHTPIEIVKYLMAGTDAVMTTSALLKNGVDYLTTLRNGLQAWMEMNQNQSVAQMKGSMSQQNVADPTAFERANYIKMLESYKSDYRAITSSFISLIDLGVAWRSCGDCEECNPFFCGFDCHLPLNLCRHGKILRQAGSPKN